MATIEKRNNSYRITVTCGYDMTGKQVRHRMTYTPEKGMTPKQIEKEVQRQAVIFEEKCKTGQTLDDNIRFAEFADIWFKDREKDLRPKTYASYKALLPRINEAIGHMKLSKIQPPHLRSFYQNLAEDGIRQDVKYSCKINLDEYINQNGLTSAELARLSDVSKTTIVSIRQGNNTSLKNAEKLCKALNKPFNEVFELSKKRKTLSTETVLHYHRLISSILGTAVEWGVLLLNPCNRTKPPRVKEKEPKYLDEVQAGILLELLEKDHSTYKDVIYLLLFTGMRRGEVLGLKWSDVDFNTSIMQITRSLHYLPGRGLYEDETKNKTSKRVIKLPCTAVTMLQTHKVKQLEQRLRLGDRWQNSEYIFTTVEGKPINPDTLSSWFSKFIKANADKLPYITLHSLRHTNATLQIAGGVPITTVAKRLGHTNSNTTGKIYAHAIKSADEVAAETLEDLLATPKGKSVG